MLYADYSLSQYRHNLVGLAARLKFLVTYTGSHLAIHEHKLNPSLDPFSSPKAEARVLRTPGLEIASKTNPHKA